MILAFDTSGPYCTAALMQGDKVLATLSGEMARGQAERLMPLLEETLAAGGITWRDLDALGVGIGPGNFTGIRIAVSAARGLALGLGIPAIGVSMFQAVALDQTSDPVAVTLPAPRDRAYMQILIAGEPVGDPRLIDPSDDVPFGDAKVVIGHRAAEIARHSGLEARDLDPPDLTDLACRIARIAAQLLADPGRGRVRPAPLYVRPADAAPPSDPPPVILDA